MTDYQSESEMNSAIGILQVGPLQRQVVSIFCVNPGPIQESLQLEMYCICMLEVENF
jgi:hypothetical protein